jgi:hypothetical protein
MSALFGSLITAFAVLFVAVSIDPTMRAAAKQTFLVSPFTGWALAGFCRMVERCGTNAAIARLLYRRQAIAPRFLTERTGAAGGE